jgi:hypothetical protein
LFLLLLSLSLSLSLFPPPELPLSPSSTSPLPLSPLLPPHFPDFFFFLFSPPPPPPSSSSSSSCVWFPAPRRSHRFLRLPPSAPPLPRQSESVFPACVSQSVNQSSSPSCEFQSPLILSHPFPPTLLHPSRRCARAPATALAAPARNAPAAPDLPSALNPSQPELNPTANHHLSSLRPLALLDPPAISPPADISLPPFADSNCKAKKHEKVASVAQRCPSAHQRKLSPSSRFVRLLSVAWRPREKREIKVVGPARLARACWFLFSPTCLPFPSHSRSQRASYKGRLDISFELVLESFPR